MISPLQTLVEIDDNRLWHVAWSHDGAYLATCGSNRSCAVFRMPSKDLTEKGAEIRKVAVLEDSHSRTIRSCEFSPPRGDNRVFLCTASFDATCVIWERKYADEYEETWEPIATLDGHENEVKAVSWSFDGTFLATCGRDKTCWVWEMVKDEEVEEWRCVSVLTGHDGDVKQVKFHPSRYMFASCSYDNTIRLWEYSDTESDFVSIAVLTGHENTVWGCVFVKDDMLVSCSQDLTIKSWKRQSMDESEEYMNDGEEKWDILFSIDSVHTRTIFSIDRSPDNWLVTASGDNSICVRKINPENGFVDEKRAIIYENAHEQDVNCVRIRPQVNGSSSTSLTMASVGDDGKLKIWKADL